MMDPKVSPDNYPEFFMDVNQPISKEEEFTCYLCNATYEKDLQLAAELGKSLLERNKELESTLKNHQNIIEDQAQEIEYLTKQTAALKDVNTSRIKIYEQLEISIQDLEHNNHKLTHQTLSDKKQIKSLLETIENLENKCEEFQSSIDKLSEELGNEKRQRSTPSTTSESLAAEKKLTNGDSSLDTNITNDYCINCTKINQQLQEIKSVNTKDAKSIDDLRDQVSVLFQENNFLRDQIDSLQHKDDELKSIQEELATLEQIRVGNLCKRCLRSTIPTEDCSSADELSLVLSNDEQELARSIAAAFFSNESSSSISEGSTENPYRMLVEKYEALLKMQEQQQKQFRHKSETNLVSQPKPCMSLRDELQMIGNYYDGDKRYLTDSEIEDENESVEQRKKDQNLKLNTTMPVKSTSSSPGCEDVRHKGTQTEVLAVLPGSFLCKISDGNDCQFSIYDDASPVESRFRKTPEYRQLFKEIFAVLKRAAEAKDEGESLPLLDDRLPSASVPADVYQQPKVPPVTPAREEPPAIPPVEKESVQAVQNELAEIKRVNYSTAVTDAEVAVKSVSVEQGSRKDVMEQLMEGVKSGGGANKHVNRRCDQRGLQSAHHVSPSPSPSHSRSTSGKRRAASKARKKRERLTDSPNRSRERHQQKSNKPVEDCVNYPNAGNSNSIDGESLPAPTRKARPVSMFVYGNTYSSASKEVAKLKILEKSYAEVLRMGRKKNFALSMESPIGGSRK